MRMRALPGWRSAARLATRAAGAWGPLHSPRPGGVSWRSTARPRTRRGRGPVGRHRGGRLDRRPPAARASSRTIAAATPRQRRAGAAAAPRRAAGVPGHLAIDLDDRPAWDRQRARGRARRSPWGETASYGEIARRVGAPRAARAVGGAVGRNPIYAGRPVPSGHRRRRHASAATAATAGWRGRGTARASKRRRCSCARAVTVGWTATPADSGEASAPSAAPQEAR